MRTAERGDELAEQDRIEATLHDDASASDMELNRAIRSWLDDRARPNNPSEGDGPPRLRLQLLLPVLQRRDPIAAAHHECCRGLPALLKLLDPLRPHGLVGDHPREYDAADRFEKPGPSSSGYARAPIRENRDARASRSGSWFSVLWSEVEKPSPPDEESVTRLW